LASNVFPSAAAADLGLLVEGVLLARVSTRSVVSRSVNWVAIFPRSASRRARRSLTFVFAALIWSKIVGIVVGMVTFCSLKLIGIINLAAV
jgi:heme/copper-type cytochrome/quinol oxidase subunit 2